MPATFHCPHCNQAYQVSDAEAGGYAGQTITCTACRKPFVVPMEVAGSAAVTAPAQQYVHYQSPAGGYGGAVAVGNGLAVASLVCGIGSIVLACVPLVQVISIPGAILAIIFGVIALRKTSNNPNVGGKGIAIAGLILGGLGVLLIGGVALFMGQMFSASRDRANRVRCMSNLKQIGTAMLLYENDNRVYPDTLDRLLLGGYIRPADLVCPASNDTPASGTTPQQQAANVRAGGHQTYVYLGAKIQPNHSPTVILAYEPLSTHHNDGANFLYGDGHVEWVPRTLAQQAIGQLQAGQNPPPAFGNGN